MIEKLQEVEKRYEELETLLCEPDVLGDRARYFRLAKERSDLEELVAAVRQQRKIEEQITENRSLLDEGDEELRELAAAELEELESTHEELTQKVRLLLLPRDPNDEKDVLLEVRSGTGGEEAALFAGDVFRMYCRFAERKGWKVEFLSRSDAGAGGIKEAICSIHGKSVYSQLRFESGVHRVQRVPDTESQGRIHTSAATVAVMPEAEDVDVEIAEKDLQVEVMRSSGPGGQSVNTTDSAVRLTHRPTGIVVRCQDEKSQHKNKAKALKILRSRLLDLEQTRQHEERSEARREMVRSGDRSEKIRTYNFPQDRVTDHRIGLTLHSLDKVLDGELDKLIEALRTHDQAERLKGGEAY
jgi:peptide chain release factor 1